MNISFCGCKFIPAQNLSTSVFQLVAREVDGVQDRVGVAAERLGHPLHKVTVGRRVTHLSNAWTAPGRTATSSVVLQAHASSSCLCGRPGSSEQPEGSRASPGVGGIHFQAMGVSDPSELPSVQGMEPPAPGTRVHAWTSLLHVLREEAPGCQDPAHHCLAAPSPTLSSHCSPAPAPPVSLTC